MDWIIIFWWPVGMVNALICRYVLPDGDQPLTYGSLIGCAMWAFGGYLLFFPAIIWTAMFACDGGHWRGRGDGFLSRKVFKNTPPK